MSENTRKWPSVMVDLETLGTSAKAAVIEMGAVCFDLETGEMGPTFAEQITLESSWHYERTIEPETLAWWMSRWREAGKVPDLMVGNSVEGAVWVFLEFWKEHALAGAEFWSRGSFDEVILRDMAEPLGGVPWEHWKVRDQRTVTAWAKRPKRTDVAHGALADAMQQVEELFACQR